MPDITMCRNRNCPLADNCFRSLAEPSECQSYARFEPDFSKEEQRFYCDHFWFLEIDEEVSS